MFYTENSLSNIHCSFIKAHEKTSKVVGGDMTRFNNIVKKLFH